MCEALSTLAVGVCRVVLRRRHLLADEQLLDGRDVHSGIKKWRWRDPLKRVPGVDVTVEVEPSGV